MIRTVIIKLIALAHSWPRFVLGSCSRRGESRFRDLEQLKPENRITNLERIRQNGEF